MSWMQKNSQKIGRCQERQCIISQILWQGQVSWCWRGDKERGCSRLPCALLTATSWRSRAAQTAMGSEVCLPCGLAHPWMESVVVQPGCSSVDCSNASVKFLNSPRELNQQFWTLSSVLIGRNGRLGRMACSEIKSQRPPGWEWRKWPQGAHVAHKLVTNDWTQSQKLGPFFFFFFLLHWDDAMPGRTGFSLIHIRSLTRIHQLPKMYSC